MLPALREDELGSRFGPMLGARGVLLGLLINLLLILLLGLGSGPARLFF